MKSEKWSFYCVTLAAFLGLGLMSLVQTAGAEKAPAEVTNLGAMLVTATRVDFEDLL